MAKDGIELHGTTIVAVRRDGRVVLAGDGQVTIGNTVMKHSARKVQRLRGGKVLAGFAGSPPTPSRSSSASRPSSRSAAATCAAPRSSWPRTGARIACCAGSRRS